MFCLGIPFLKSRAFHRTRARSPRSGLVMSASSVPSSVQMSKMAVVGFRNAKGPETLSWRRARLRPDGVHRVSQKDKLRTAAGRRAEEGLCGWAKEMLRAALGREAFDDAAGAAAFGGAAGSHWGVAKEMLRVALGRGSVMMGSLS